MVDFSNNDELKHLEKLFKRFSRRCRTSQDREDLMQDIYVIWLSHRDKYNPEKSAFNTWCQSYLFKKVLTYLDSALVRNQARSVPTEELPIQSTRQLSLDTIRKLRKLTDCDINAINKYDVKLAHHRRGPFARRIKRLKQKLEE